MPNVRNDEIPGGWWHAVKASRRRSSSPRWATGRPIHLARSSKGSNGRRPRRSFERRLRDLRCSRTMGPMDDRLLHAAVGRWPRRNEQPAHKMDERRRTHRPPGVLRRRLLLRALRKTDPHRLKLTRFIRSAALHRSSKHVYSASFDRDARFHCIPAIRMGTGSWWQSWGRWSGARPAGAGRFRLRVWVCVCCGCRSRATP